MSESATVRSAGAAALDAAARERADRQIEAGNAAEDAGDIRTACEHYREAVALAPRYARAHLNLGLGLEASGHEDGAIAAYETALACEPANAPANYNLGRLLYTRGTLSRAAELLRSALVHKAQFPEAHVVLSSVYDAQGNLEAAARELEAALTLRPDSGALINYAFVLKRLGRPADAEAALRRALAIDHQSADAHQELGSLLCARGELAEAERSLRLALRYKPGFAEAHFALSNVHDARGDLGAAALALESALEARPDWAAALNNYGDVLQRLQRLPEAEAALRRALALEPQLANAYQTLGAILVNQSRVPEALEVFRAGREHDPQGFQLESAELFALNLSDDITAEDLFARHRAFGTRLETAYPPRFLPFRNVRDPDRRLRIGYVSPDFCNHAVAQFALPLIEAHDRSAYEIHCYSVGTVADDATRNLKRLADAWTDAASLPHDALADTIHRDGIDILVDLAGHSGPRLPVFAQQPAPVQVGWLGYLNTTGLTRLHYRLCDHHTDPAGAERLHTESLLRLPGSQWCYRPRPALDDAVPDVAPFVRNGFVTFGSFNHMPKLSPSARALWARILSLVPDSRLVFVGVPEGEARDRLIKDLEDAGVARSRLTIAGRVPLQEYFLWFNRVDIALDTTPYSGGTTTCDALWMGVPVLAVPGSRPMSRSAAGILSVAGFAEWISSSPDDYVRRAVEFARAGAPGDLRKTVRRKMRESPLMDEARFARDVEAAYRRAWQTYCGGPPVRAGTMP